MVVGCKVACMCAHCRQAKAHLLQCLRWGWICMDKVMGGTYTFHQQLLSYGNPCCDAPSAQAKSPLVCVYRVSIKESSVAKLGSVCRRIYRIFSHAYFHHRQIFDKYEVGVYNLCFPSLSGCCCQARNSKMWFYLFLPGIWICFFFLLLQKSNLKRS